MYYVDSLQLHKRSSVVGVYIQNDVFFRFACWTFLFTCRISYIPVLHAVFVDVVHNIWSLSVFHITTADTTWFVRFPSTYYIHTTVFSDCFNMVVSDERKYVRFWDQRASYNIFFVHMKGRCICNVYLLGITFLNNWLFKDVDLIPFMMPHTADCWS